MSRFVPSAWWRNHQDAIHLSFQYLIARRGATAFTMLVIGLCLLLPGTLSILLEGGRGLSEEWLDSGEIMIFLSSGDDVASAQKILETIRFNPQIESAILRTPEEVIQELISLAGFEQPIAEEENPLPYIIQARPVIRDTQQVAGLIDEIAKMKGVDLARYDMLWLQRVQQLDHVGRSVALLLFMLVIAIIIAVISNTIRLEVQSRAVEIKVLQLVGASNAYLRRPYLYAGLWIAIGGSLLGLVLLSVLQWWLWPGISQLVSGLGGELQLSLTYWIALAFVVLSLWLICVVTAWAAVSLQVKKLSV
ncbi:MAG: cell division protein FtsX [bacterium]